MTNTQNKIIQNIRNTAIAALFAATMHAQTTNSQIETPITVSQPKTVPSTTLTLTEIVAENQNVLSRAEVLCKNLPEKTDFYAIAETFKDANQYKIRLQSAPICNNNVGLGYAEQITGASHTRAHTYAGPLLRLMAKNDQVSFKADTRYFPFTKDVDGYITMKANKLFGDLLWKYNRTSHKATLRVGADYAINSNVSLGPEIKYIGKIDDLKKTYIGIRARVNL